jgi:vacuolar-type H+-ATPase subunit H
VGHAYRQAAANRLQPDADGLLRLLEMEAALAARHAAAAAEADQLIADARRRVTDLDAEAVTDLARAVEQLTARVGQEQEQQARRLLADAAARAEQLHQVPANRVEDLAARVVGRVLAGGEGHP